MSVKIHSTNYLASSISGIPIRRKKVSAPMEQIEARCPQCSTPIRYQQRPKPNGYKSLICGQCGSNLISRYVDGEFTLELRTPREENISCPSCSEALTTQLDPMPGSSTVINCSKCKSRIRVYRTPIAVGIKVLPEDFIVPAVPITEEFLQQVREALPQQPWPKGAAKDAAAKLRVSVASVSKAIEELIRREVYKPQFDGELYTKEKTQK